MRYAANTGRAVVDYLDVGASFAFCENNQEKSPLSWPLVFVGVMNKPADE